MRMGVSAPCRCGALGVILVQRHTAGARSCRLATRATLVRRASRIRRIAGMAPSTRRGSRRVGGKARGEALRGTVQDITRRRAQQQALELARERLRAMYETTLAMAAFDRGNGPAAACQRSLAGWPGWPARATPDRHGRAGDVPSQLFTHSGELVDVLLSTVFERDKQGQANRSPTTPAATPLAPSCCNRAVGCWAMRFVRETRSHA